MPDLPDFLRDLIETRNVEYKSAAPWSKIKQKVMKSAIAMSNNADGGTIVIGVKPATPTIAPRATGLTPGVARTYANLESIQAAISECASPNLKVEVQPEEHFGKLYIVVRVTGLDPVPHIAVKEVAVKKQGIAKGFIYVRTDKPSSQQCDALTWLELMQRVEVAMAGAFISKMEYVGCRMRDCGSPEKSDDTDKFLSEREK